MGMQQIIQIHEDFATGVVYASVSVYDATGTCTHDGVRPFSNAEARDIRDHIAEVLAEQQDIAISNIAATHAGLVPPGTFASDDINRATSATGLDAKTGTGEQKAK